MSNIFLRLLNMSLTASVMALAVMLIRLLLRKAPKWIFCVMWGLVALRLVLPFSIESVLSLMPSAEPIPAEILETDVPKIDSGIPPLDELVNPALQEAYAPSIGTAAASLENLTKIIALIWLIGAVAMIGYALISSALLRRKLKDATPYQPGIKQSDFAPSPFVLGILRPVIYLPYRADEADLPYIIAHERAHIARRDHLWKPLGFLLLAVYWFNPVMWLSYILLCRDIEAACDEKVIRDLDGDALRAYSGALLNARVSRRRIAACPLAFGEVGVKERIKNVMSYKKPAFWLILAALIAAVTVTVCLLTSPAKDYQPKLFGFCHTADTGDEGPRRVPVSLWKAQYIADTLINAQWYSTKSENDFADAPGPNNDFTNGFKYDYEFRFRNQTVRYNSTNGGCLDITQEKLAFLPYSALTEFSKLLHVPGPFSCFPELIEYHVPDPDKLSLSVVQNNLYSEYPHITVRWTNKSDEPLFFSDTHSLYRLQDGIWVSTNEQKISFLVQYAVSPIGDENIFLTSPLTEGETYRLYLDTWETGEYWIDFVYGAGYDAISDSRESVWTEPPAMTVKTGNRHICAKTGTVSWTCHDVRGTYGRHRNRLR